MQKRCGISTALVIVDDMNQVSHTMTAIGVRLRMYVRMYVCMHVICVVCMYVCMYVCISVHSEMTGTL